MASYASAAATPSKQASLHLPATENYQNIDVDCKTPTVHDDDDEFTKYILGTLLVRVVAARKLALGKGSNTKQRRREAPINPYASVRFYEQSQRTTECYCTSDPIWPRGETMFMDVSLPLKMVTYMDPKTSTQPLSNDHVEIDEPILTIALFHNNKNDYDCAMKKGKLGKPQKLYGDSDEPFLGMASVNVRQLLTGKKAQIDEWMELSGGGVVRLVIEYEASDLPPRPGDIVRFTQFCHARDLYPIHHKISYQVIATDDTHVTLTTTSPEGWVSTFQVHRYMLLCEERHQDAVEFCADELATVKMRLAHSPMIHTLGETIQRVPEDGLIEVSVGALQGGVELLGRWWQGGVDTAVGDIVHATNWDGRHVPTLDEDDSDSEDEESEVDRKPAASILPPNDDDEDVEPLPGMPCCPITGEPMRNPVVAGDGHTYERSAIYRWLQGSDKSPLTGSLLPHKELVPNYGLMSSLEDNSRKQAALVSLQEEESKPAAVERDDNDENKVKAQNIPENIVNSRPGAVVNDDSLVAAIEMQDSKSSDVWNPISGSDVAASTYTGHEEEWKAVANEHDKLEDDKTPLASGGNRHEPIIQVGEVAMYVFGSVSDNDVATVVATDECVESERQQDHERS